MKTNILKLALAAIIIQIAPIAMAQQKDSDAEIERLKKELIAANERATVAEAMVVKCQHQAEASAQLAMNMQKSAERCRYILMAKMQAVKSLELDNSPDLQARVAQLAYKFYERNLGQQPDDDIYKGLYHALERLNDPVIKQIQNKTWPENVAAMSKSLCGHIKQNMNKEEWYNFVGTDLPYEAVCEGLPLNNK